MEQLTQKQVLAMSQKERTEQLDYWQDKACNLHYVLEPLASEIAQRNISLLEAKILFNEF